MEVYVTVCWLLCQDTHLSARGLDKYLKLDGEDLSTTWDINIDDFNAALQTFTAIYATFLSECSKYFKVPSETELDKLTSGLVNHPS